MITHHVVMPDPDANASALWLIVLLVFDVHARHIHDGDGGLDAGRHSTAKS